MRVKVYNIYIRDWYLGPAPGYIQNQLNCVKENSCHHEGTPNMLISTHSVPKYLKFFSKTTIKQPQNLPRTQMARTLANS